MAEWKPGGDDDVQVDRPIKCKSGLNWVAMRMDLKSDAPARTHHKALLGHGGSRGWWATLSCPCDRAAGGGDRGRKPGGPSEFRSRFAQDLILTATRARIMPGSPLAPPCAPCEHRSSRLAGAPPPFRRALRASLSAHWFLQRLFQFSTPLPHSLGISSGSLLFFPKHKPGLAFFFFCESPLMFAPRSSRLSPPLSW